MSIANELGLDLTPEGASELAIFDQLEDLVIEVGYQADEKAADEEPSLAEIAYWNHYGTMHKDGSDMIPARPFMDALDEQSDELAEFSQKALASLPTAESIAGAVGAKAQEMVQSAMRDETWEPNAPITVDGGWMINEYGRNGPVPVKVKGKKSTKPLIDTGALRQGCQYVIKKEGQE